MHIFPLFYFIFLKINNLLLKDKKKHSFQTIVNQDICDNQFVWNSLLVRVTTCIFTDEISVFAEGTSFSKSYEYV